jgi:hypothetical protein
MEFDICVYVTAEMRADLRRLYCRRSPFLQAFFVGLGLAAFALAVPLFPFHEHLQIWERGFLAGVGTALFVIGLALRPIWWRWHYWPSVQRYLPEAEPLCGRIRSDGIQWQKPEQTDYFDLYPGARMDANALLLFTSKAYAIPLHRCLFKTEAEWQFVCESVREARKHRTLRQRLETPL